MRSAEELFATHGVDATSLAEVNKHAGQLNQKAVTYHFGSKSNLIMAIFNRHSEDIERQRGAMLEKAGDSPSLRQLVELVVLPIASKLNDEDGGRYYLKLSSQMLDSPEFTAMRFEHAATRNRLTDVQQMLNPFLSHLTENERRARSLYAYRVLYQGLAFLAEGGQGISRASFLSILIETMECIITGSGSRDQ